MAQVCYHMVALEIFRISLNKLLQINFWPNKGQSKIIMIDSRII